MTFQKYSSDKRELIEKKLRVYLGAKAKEEIPEVFKKQQSIQMLEEFVLKGKLIRGTLFLFGYEMLGGTISEEIVGIACAIELTHSALLIQDDIIDNDYTRRGGKTIFAKYKERGEELLANDSLHYGISIAIVVADVAFFFATDLISRFESPSLGRLLSFYAQEIYLVALSEGIDSEFGQIDYEPTKEEIYAIYKYKTARYTFSLPFVMGGIAVGASKNDTKVLEEIGELIGIIFQLKDDEIGLFGSQKTIGKPVGSDIRENKKTIMRVLLYESASLDEINFLNTVFGNEKVTANQIDEIKKLIKKYTIQEKINKEIEEIMEKAWNLFEKLDVDNSYTDVLKDLMEFNLKRSY